MDTRTSTDTLGPIVTVTTDPASPAPGEAVTATAVLVNDCPFPLRGAVLYLLDPGATAAARTLPLGDVRRGARVTRSWRTALPSDAAGDLAFTAHLLYDVDGHSADFARGAKTVTVPYEPNGVRAPYRTFSTADNAQFGQYGSQLVIWAGGRDLSGGTDEKAGILLPGSAAARSTVEVETVALTGSDNPVAKYGIAVANDLTDPARGGYAVLTMSQGYGVEFMTDSDGDGRLDTWAGGGTSTHPARLRLVRDGTSYTAQLTTNGLAWTDIGHATVPSASGALDAGVVASAVNLNHPGTTVRAVFDHFTVEET